MAKYDDLSFAKAFAAARKDLGGSGNTFMWNGKKFTTDLKGESKTKATSKGFSTDMASKAIDKASGINTPTASTVRPKARPNDATAKAISVPEKITVATIKAPSTGPSFDKSGRGDKVTPLSPVKQTFVNTVLKAAGDATTRKNKTGMANSSGYSKGGSVKKGKK